jgi:UDP-N-acetylmuramyl pentapeptide phosphotransferase/UDP-N-acetylglucosamine-1-phosphate transferase
MRRVIGGLAIASFVVAWAAGRLLASRLRSVALDQPNARSLHERPVPRTGGIAILLGAALALELGGGELWPLMAMALALAAVSFLDDLRGLPTVARLLAHFAACGAFAWYVLSPMHPVELAVLIVAGVWITNLYNFMDGADGLAGGMAAIGFGAYSAAAGLAGHLPLASMCAALAAASAGFLTQNFFPARLFLGDVGSIPLGFLVYALGILGWRDDIWPLWFPVLVFAPFIGDATLTLLKRLLRMEAVWRAHRDHYYQRMVRMGVGHRGTALAAYAVMLACAIAALLARQQPPAIQASVFLGMLLLLGMLAAWVDVRWRRSAHDRETA